MKQIETNGDLLHILIEFQVGLNYSDELKNKFFGLINNTFTEAEEKLVKLKLQNFCNYASKVFKAHSLNYELFKVKKKKWCEKEIEFPVAIKIKQIYDQRVTRSRSRVTSKTIQEPGTSKNFEECTERHKRRRSSRLSSLSYDEIIQCSTYKMKLNKKNDERKVLKFITENPANVKQVRQYCDKLKSEACSKAEKYSNEMALAIYISAKLTRSKYNLLRNAAKQFPVNYYPSYNELRNAKQDCYPDRDSITINENSAKIKLQELLDHTARRLIKSLKEIKKYNLGNFNELSLITKWGCDGAAGQSVYKQKISSNLNNNDDASVFMISLVPIKLIQKADSQVIWANEQTSSTWYCRPIEFTYTKESNNLIKNKVSSLQSEIEELRPTIISTATVSHELVLTMIDGKVCNAITENLSTMKCYICHATVKEMNNLVEISEKISNPDFYKFGISSLHAWIRCFECLLHISYNLQFKKWSARSEHEKTLKKARKAHIQTKFKEQMGLNVDIVKQGLGTTNDGNTARRFFQDPAKSAQITELDENLINRFAVILQAIASNEKINTGKFDTYTKETAKLYVSLYSWYYMPPTVHKILIHGADIIENAIVPIGQLSEEAQESRNKDFRKYREYNTRKVSRIANNQDLLNHLLISSDPYITMLRYNLQQISKGKSKLFKETLDLLDQQQESSEISEEDTSEEDTSEEEESDHDVGDEEIQLSDEETDNDNISITSDDLSDDVFSDDEH